MQFLGDPVGYLLGMEAITNKEVRRLVEERGAQVVEVLPRPAYEQEHIAGALNIPLKKLEAEAGEQLDRERPVIVYCSGYL